MFLLLFLFLPGVQVALVGCESLLHRFVDILGAELCFQKLWKFRVIHRQGSLRFVGKVAILTLGLNELLIGDFQGVLTDLQLRVRLVRGGLEFGNPFVDGL